MAAIGGFGQGGLASIKDMVAHIRSGLTPLFQRQKNAFLTRLYLFTPVGIHDWVMWAQTHIVQMTEFFTRTYVVVTWNLRYLAYYTAEAIYHHRQLIQWTIYKDIPQHIKKLDKTLRKAIRKGDSAVRAHSDRRAAEVKHHADLITAALALLESLHFKSLTALVWQLHSNAIDHADKRARQVHAYANMLYLAALRYTAQSITALRADTLALINQALKYAANQAAEALAKAKAYADTLIKLLNKDVSAAYDKTRADQATGINKVLDVVVEYNPEIKAAVTDLAKVVLSLAEIDDPAIRIVATVLLKQVIDHLGIDTAIGAFVNGVILPFIGGSAPKTIAAVASDAGTRINALQDQWQSFWANGGEEVEQLGDDLHEMGSLIFMGAIFGLTTAAITDPVDAARITNEILGGPINAIGTQLVNLLDLSGIA